MRRLHYYEAATAPDLTQLTVEHLAPQGVARPADMSPADAARLGNLILVPRDINDELGDLPCPEKRDLLRQAAERGVHIDPVVLEADTWDKAMILKRTQRLAELAYTEVWALKQ